MAISNNRLFASYIRSFFSGDAGSGESVATITTKTLFSFLAQETTVDSVPTSAASAVTFYVNARKNNESHFAIISAALDGTTDCDYTEYGTIITDTALANFKVDINSGSFRLRATPTTTSVTFKVTKVVVPA
jgi:hypothetical protein